MKLFLDQNLSFKIIPKLEKLFPGSKHIKEFGLEHATDEEIYKFSANNNFIIVSQDADFYEMSLVSDLKPKIIWLRCGNTSTEDICQIIQGNYEKIMEFINSSETCLQLF
ncbi:MAG: DUF5615 family PIN-like protein [Ignavibacteria bacterium]